MLKVLCIYNLKAYYDGNQYSATDNLHPTPSSAAPTATAEEILLRVLDYHYCIGYVFGCVRIAKLWSSCRHVC